AGDRPGGRDAGHRLDARGRPRGWHARGVQGRGAGRPGGAPLVPRLVADARAAGAQRTVDPAHPHRRALLRRAGAPARRAPVPPLARGARDRVRGAGAAGPGAGGGAPRPPHRPRPGGVPGAGRRPLMFEPLLERIRGRISGERALAAVAAVARFHRVQASPGYDAAADWLAGELAAAGLTVEIEHVPADGRTRRLGMLMPEGWQCTHGRATLVDGRVREPLCDHAALKLAVIQRSAPARGRFPLVALEDGTEDAHYQGLDVRGRVVLTAGAVHRVHALAVVERGAAGILADGRRLMPPVRGPEHDREAVNYTSFWWAEDQPRGWGFVVSPAVGARLRARLREGAALELEVELESRRFATRIPLLSATLPGATPEEVLVVSHLCHPEPSANDNGSG